jgi:hypothetical protein
MQRLCAGRWADLCQSTARTRRPSLTHRRPVPTRVWLPAPGHGTSGSSPPLRCRWRSPLTGWSRRGIKTPPSIRCRRRLLRPIQPGAQREQRVTVAVVRHGGPLRAISVTAMRSCLLCQPEPNGLVSIHSAMVTGVGRSVIEAVTIINWYRLLVRAPRAPHSPCGYVELLKRGHQFGTLPSNA